MPSVIFTLLLFFCFMPHTHTWRDDLRSGFLVSLIALPLSLGVASASGFPPMMGVLTSLISGLVVSWFVGAPLAIKAPAAGLVVVIGGCVDAFSWPVAALAVLVTGLLQWFIGRMKWASLLDFFPVSALRGLLAAIGVMVFARQIHLLLGTNPDVLAGKTPLELLYIIPQSLMDIKWPIAIIGCTALVIIVLLPILPGKFLKKLPEALVALVVEDLVLLLVVLRVVAAMVLQVVAVVVLVPSIQIIQML